MANPSEKSFFGHPRQLATLFHIELWERFSFYGLQGILLIYLYFETSKGGLAMDKKLASLILTAYSSSIYLFTILGGWLSSAPNAPSSIPALWSCAAIWPWPFCPASAA